MKYFDFKVFCENCLRNFHIWGRKIITHTHRIATSPNKSSWRVDWGYVKFLMCFPNFWTFWPKILFSKYGSKKDKTINISRNNEPIYYQWGLKWKFMIADTLFKTFFFKKILEIWFFGFFFYDNFFIQIWIFMEIMNPVQQI